MKISLNAVVHLLRILVLLISVEYILPAFVIAEHRISDETSIQASPDELPFGLFFPGKAEQKEKSEEEAKDRFFTVELSDFSKLAIQLSKAYSHLVDFTFVKQQDDLQSVLFRLFCVLII